MAEALPKTNERKKTKVKLPVMAKRVATSQAHYSATATPAAMKLGHVVHLVKL